MAPTQGQRTLIIIPTYNERESIRILVERAREIIDADILIIDDNSPDGTGELIRRLAEDDRHIHVVRRKAKQGIGSAYRLGFQWAFSRDYTFLIQMDADLSHDPGYLKDFAAQRGEFDLVIGSRYVSGGRIRNWKRLRKLTSWAGNIYTLIVLRLKDRRYQIHDSTSGFKSWRVRLLREMSVDETSSEGYAFQIDLHWRAVQHNARILEIPIVFEDRKAGQSKLGGAKVVFEALVVPWKLRNKLTLQE